MTSGDMGPTSYGQPGDYLEDALFSWRPESCTPEKVVYSALMMAGYEPPFTGQPVRELTTVAQDLIDHDPRKGEQ
jgi:hypothetical protein